MTDDGPVYPTATGWTVPRRRSALRRRLNRIFPAPLDPERAEIEQYARAARHAADLTRLGSRIEQLHREADRTGHHLRVTATAYDQALVLAATALGIAEGQLLPLSSADRITLEAQLAIAGLRW